MNCCQEDGVAHGLLQETFSSPISAAVVPTPTQKVKPGTALWSPERAER